jgi:RNA polymerase sigma-70 factor (ECF subfamily)
VHPHSLRPWTEPGRDHDLLIAAQRGDLAALFTLLGAHRDTLWRLCVALTLDQARAERLFHETLVRAAKSLRTVPADAPMLHWLARLATHLAVAWSRHEGPRTPGEPTGAWPVTSGEAPFFSHDPRLLATLERFPESDRLLLLLAVVERLSYGDVARVTKRDAGEVVRRLTELREWLAGEVAA